MPHFTGVANLHAGKIQFKVPGSSLARDPSNGFTVSDLACGDKS